MAPVAFESSPNCKGRHRGLVTTWSHSILLPYVCSHPHFLSVILVYLVLSLQLYLHCLPSPPPVIPSSHFCPHLGI